MTCIRPNCENGLWEWPRISDRSYLEPSSARPPVGRETVRANNNQPKSEQALQLVTSICIVFEKVQFKRTLVGPREAINFWLIG